MITWVRRNKKIPDEQFAEIEKHIGVKLPKDYIHWTQQYFEPEDEAYYQFDSLYDPDMIIDEFEALYFKEETENNCLAILPS
ncbi:SMI1/KNR4 family protein [Thermoactinomyces mirandus]|uniref:SMI1/KNR4 family protein n=1 Tax=Thermoactinomyces mirandus TaxID=2756294 RepID=A0A7W1XPN5_9BACL|nr:SMI1/KNR4 family protein [Thermoactinomyces mirandus]MBA4600978.1 SMI1/KNR4 family protein [Thermoactinomyces mirandus]